MGNKDKITREQAECLIDRFVEKLAVEWPGFVRKLVGCTDSEVHEIGQAIGLPLPEVYKAFLRRVTNSPRCYDFSYAWLTDVECWQECFESVAELVSTPERRLIPFMNHDGYMWWFFWADDGDDPAVYYAQWPDYSPEKKLADHLSDFLFEHAYSLEW